MPSRRTGILLLVALLGPVLALVGSPPALADEVVAVIEAAEESSDGTVPVIVELDMSVAPEGALSRRDVNEQRDEIDATAADALADMDGEADVDQVEVF